MKMNGQELLAIARRDKPGVRYALSRAGNCIGAWVEDKGRYVVVASQALTGEWYSVPYELFVNGEPVLLSHDWQE